MKLKQLTFPKTNGWGGKRKGAGRPNKTGQVNHLKREKITGRTPSHITWRLGAEGVNLRSRQIAAAFRAAAKGAKEHGLRILHYSILRNHLHLIVEADGNHQLESGLKSFAIRLSLCVRSIVTINGPLFNGRYHLHALKSPREMKNALAYVLQNFSKHSRLIFHVDEFSSAPWFGDWRKLLGVKKAGPILEDHRAAARPDYLSAPRSWLAREGWMRS